MRRLLASALLALLLTTPAQAHTTHGSALCVVTGYTWTGYRTSTGVWPQVHHTVAVDPAYIPYGSHIRIAGLPWWYVAEDSGGAVRGWHLDVFVGSVAEAYAITSVRRCWWWR